MSSVRYKYELVELTIEELNEMGHRGWKPAGPLTCHIVCPECRWRCRPCGCGTNQMDVEEFRGLMMLEIPPVKTRS